jgi:hypothetical protein
LRRTARQLPLLNVYARTPPPPQPNPFLPPGNESKTGPRPPTSPVRAEATKLVKNPAMRKATTTTARGMSFLLSLTPRNEGCFLFFFIFFILFYSFFILFSNIWPLRCPLRPYDVTYPSFEGFRLSIPTYGLYVDA